MYTALKLEENCDKNVTEIHLGYITAVKDSRYNCGKGQMEMMRHYLDVERDSIGFSGLLHLIRVGAGISLGFQ